MSGDGGLWMMRRVFDEVSAVTGVEPYRLAGGNAHRTGDVSAGRALFVGVCREITDRSYPQLSRFLSLASHSSCIDQHERYTRAIKTGEPVRVWGGAGSMAGLRAAVYERLGAEEGGR